MLKVEAEKCLAQSERINKEREDFESEIYAKVCTLCYHLYSIFTFYYLNFYLILQIELQLEVIV